ncbi:MAG: sodium:proton antiporter [Tibeticola sp.]
MNVLDIAAVCLSVTALLAWVNHRFVGLPAAVGVMATALLLSLALIGLNAAGLDFGLKAYEESLIRSIDFSGLLMQGMLSLLLFAGALHVDLSELRAYRWQIGSLAVVSTTLSTLAVGFGVHFALPWVGLELPLIWCLLFGALISPTDPIAVLGILKTSGAPRNLQLVITGESLFNDGVGVVLFALFLGMLGSGAAPSLAQGLSLFLHEAGGGLLFGLALGYLCFRMLRSVDNYQVEVLLTLAAVMGGYALAHRLHVSGPLAMVVAGLVIGNHGRALAMSDTTRRYVDMFWELLDEILNAVLFVLIGMEVMLVAFSVNVLVAALLAMGVTLAARGLTAGLPVRALGSAFRLPAGSGRVLTWGGLRGGISVALALSLPASPERDLILALTYAIVVFSILGQGLSMRPLVRATLRDGGEPPGSAPHGH